MRVRSVARRTLATMASTARGANPRANAVVLLYHSVHETLPYASVRPDVFSQHLEWLVTNCELVDYEAIARSTFPQEPDRPVVAITFDDGFEDNHRVVLPQLIDAGITATFFATTGLIESNLAVIDRFARLHGVNRELITGMDWAQLEDLRDAGMMIGAHTVSHPNLAVLPPELVLRELEWSKQILEDRLEVPVVHMAYPFGKPKHNFNRRVIGLAQVSGYASAAAVLFRAVQQSDSSYVIPRISVTGDDVDSLRQKVYGAWDLVGMWQEKAPRFLSAAVSPERTFRTELSLLSPISRQAGGPSAPVDGDRNAVGRLTIWPPLAFTDVAATGSALPVFPLDQPNVAFYRRARQGLWHGVRALGLTPGDEILVPTYHQGSEIEAFVRAGLVLRYYEVDDMLQPVERDLDRLVGPRTRALHLIHFWGFPALPDRWRKWCDGRGLFLVEDGAQALLARSAGRPVGSFGDLAVFCLYKSFGLPDGAAVICKADLTGTFSKASSGVSAALRRVGSSFAQQSVALSGLYRSLGRGDAVRRGFGEFLPGELELDDPNAPPSRATTMMLRRVVDRAAAVRRRHNFLFLRSRLEPRMPRALSELVPGAVPIAFPVESKDAERLQRALYEFGIDAGRLWPTWHPTLSPESHPIADYFRSSVVAVPCHQELREQDLQHIADAVLRIETG